MAHRFTCFARGLLVALLIVHAVASEGWAQKREQAPKEPPPAAANAPGDARGDTRRVELNLLGQTDAEAGESRRNENVQFNLVDNNALKELNIRLGTTATIIREFLPERGYFSAEFGNAPSPVLHVKAADPRGGFHGSAWAAHLNSVFSARSFFQVGDVKPARENDYGFTAGIPLRPWAGLTVEASQQKIRGSVNGNVLVPRADERTPLATDPAVRAIVARWLAAYPAALPNRTDVDPRALNTNATQSIDNHNASVRLDLNPTARDRAAAHYGFTAQGVDAFQLVAGQNPNTDTRSHRARLTWSRQWSGLTITDVSAGFDRVGSLLVPEARAVGPMVIISGLELLGPVSVIPIDRAQNLFRYGGLLRRARGSHSFTAGFDPLRRQLNGRETDAHRGFFQFGSDFGRDSITNLRMGTPSQHVVSIGDVHRGFRNLEAQVFAGDEYALRGGSLRVRYGLRYQPVFRPVEVNGRNAVAYDCDCNNLAPQLGIALRLPRAWGTLRAAYGLHYGEIFPVTFQQVRFTPPGSVKFAIPAPYLADPLGRLPEGGNRSDVLPNLYLLDRELATPYSHQYNFSWEPELSRAWRLQLGYVGSRSHKLLNMRYRNRAHPVAGVALSSATVNLRRADAGLADIRHVVNGSRGYFDAARVALVVTGWRGLTLDAAYWFSKAIDLGSSYTNTAYDQDSRQARSQSEFEVYADMKSPSSFDQTHAFLWRASWTSPAGKGRGRAAKLAGGWTISVVSLVKTGIPFNVVTGSDAAGFGNVDGSGSDRPNLLDPAILGRTIGHPDTSRRLLPRQAFTFIRPGEERGNLGRNVFRRGGIANVNASLARTWGFAGDKRLTWRAESVNFFNTPQFAEPGFELASPNFGQITNTLNDGRSFRFLLQLGW